MALQSDKKITLPSSCWILAVLYIEQQAEDFFYAVIKYPLEL